MGVAEHNGVRSNFSKDSGKWYWEVSIDSGTTHYVGIATSSAFLDDFAGSDEHAYSYHDLDGKKYTNGGDNAYGDTYVAGDVIGVALDLDSDKVFFSKNGVWQGSGDPSAGTNQAFPIPSGTYYAIWSGFDEGVATLNSGDTAFAYSVPDGYRSFGRYVATKWDDDKKGTYASLSDDQLTASGWYGLDEGFSAHCGTTLATVGKSEGKWYWEVQADAYLDYYLPRNNFRIGIGTSATALNQALGIDANSYGFDSYSGLRYHDGVPSEYVKQIDYLDVIGIALDLDNKKLWFSRNGAWLRDGVPGTGTNPIFEDIAASEWFPACSVTHQFGYANGRLIQLITSAVLRTRDSNMSYAAPDGFLAYDAEIQPTETNLAESTTIADEVIVNVEYGAPGTAILVELSERMTSADTNFADLPGESGSEESAVSGEAFTTSDEVVGETSSEALDEGMALSDVIEADAPDRVLNEGFTVEDAPSSAESVMNTTVAEDVEISADIAGGFLADSVYPGEGVTTADVISLERDLAIQYQSEGVSTADTISGAIERGVSAAETQQIFDTLGFGWNKSLTSEAAIADTVSAEMSWGINEILTAQDAVVSQWAGTENVASTLGIFGNALIVQIFNEAIISTADAVDAVAYLHKMISAVESSMNAADAVSSKATFNPLVAESVAVAGTISVLKKLYPVVAETADITDAAQPGWLKAIIDGATIADAAIIQMVAMHILTDSLEATDTAIGLFNFTDTISDTFEAVAAATIQQLIQESIEDILHFGITITLDGDVWSCWVINGNAFNMSVYSGFSFNSYAVYNNIAYGCKEDGIYRLDGSTDNGETIHSGVVLPETNFNSTRNKRFRKAWFGMSGSSPSIRMETESGDQTYTITNSKANLNRSQKGKNWTVKIQDFDDIEHVDLIPIILTR
jgi:hypothetical protein